MQYNLFNIPCLKLNPHNQAKDIKNIDTHCRKKNFSASRSWFIQHKNDLYKNFTTKSMRKKSQFCLKAKDSDQMMFHCQFERKLLPLTFFN